MHGAHLRQERSSFFLVGYVPSATGLCLSQSRPHAESQHWYQRLRQSPPNRYRYQQLHTTLRSIQFNCFADVAGFSYSIHNNTASQLQRLVYSALIGSSICPVIWGQLLQFWWGGMQSDIKIFNLQGLFFKRIWWPAFGEALQICPGA